MFKLKRNQVIIAALVVMICVAGYLNYLDTRGGLADDENMYGMTYSGDISAIVLDGLPGQQVAVSGQNNYEPYIGTYNGEINTEVDTAESEPGTAVFVNASSDSSFFVQAKLGREQDRSKQKETLNSLIGSTELDQVTKTLCAEAVLEITRRMESESATESALVAKGFGESYVRIDDNWVEVIINKSVITDQELAQLEDIVTRLTGAQVTQIRLSSVK